MKKLAALIVLLMLSSQLFSWGFKGHQVVADIAEAHLSPAAKSGIRSLLGNESLASISNWADEIRPHRPETSNWHFVNIPASASYDEGRDCKLSPKGDCVVAEIERAKAALADAAKPREARIEALKFLVHFVGDVHQPMRTIGEARGGLDIHVVEFGSNQCGKYPCNLRYEWDTGLLEHTGFSESDYVAHLEELVQQKQLVVSGSPADWADESHDLARAAWLPEGGAIDEKYYAQSIRIIDERLTMAGLRLAALLNEVFHS